ncbi:ABC transporter substrate-binding protein [Verrucomicrobiota bacterium]
MVKKQHVVILILVIAAALVWSLLHFARKPVRVWFVSYVFLDETRRLQENIRQRLEDRHSGKQVIVESRCAFGKAQELKEILTSADSGEANVVVAIGLDATRQAYETVENIPVVYCKVGYPEAYGFLDERPGLAPFVGIGEESPVEEYCTALQRLNHTWGDAGAIIPKGYLAGEAECEAFQEAYKHQYNRIVKEVVIDAKTCAQLMDVVFAYNLIISQKVTLFYAINDGNLSKYLGALIRQCARQEIPVIAGGRAVLNQGGILAIVPDENALAGQCASMVARILDGEDCDHEKVNKFITLWNTNALAEYGLRVEEERGPVADFL